MAAGTVTYRYPKTTAPAAGEAKGLVVADVAMGAQANNDPTDVTHNMNLSIDGSTGFPKINAILTAQGAAAKMPTITYKDANTITITTASNVSTGDHTVRLFIERPHSLTK
jgi:hypothetical protein